MADSPVPRAPLDPAEKPILDSILGIRDNLSILKQDRSTYVKSADVLKYYNQLMEQVKKLNEIRQNKRHEQNRVDSVLDDCFQLISLFFLTIGRNSEAPAVYSAISTVKRLLDHLKEAKFYSYKDLDSMCENLKKWERELDQSSDEQSEHLLPLLRARLEICKSEVKQLQNRLSRMDPETMDTFETLVSILRSLSACNCRTKYPKEEVRKLHAQLVEIQKAINDEPETTHDGQTAEEAYADRLALVNFDDDEVKDGRTIVHGLLTRCFLWVEIIEERRGKIDERFQDTYDQLLKIRNTLEQMNLTHAWSMRETDLYSYQRQLTRIDDARVNSEFVDVEGKPADLHAFRTLLYLLRKSYALIYQYIISAEPVSEALLPIYNQVLALKRCLLEVKRSGGVDSPRELYPYSMKLNSIENMKKDGKFMVGGDVPDGQAAVSSLLKECFDLAYGLRDESKAHEESIAAAAPAGEVANGVNAAA